MLQMTLDRLLVSAAAYGLVVNWSKTVHMQVRHSEDLLSPSGEAIKSVSQAVYLGGLLCNNGLANASLARRLGEAKLSFHELSLVWAHANVLQENPNLQCMRRRKVDVQHRDTVPPTS